MEDPSPPPSADDSDPRPQIQQYVKGGRSQMIGQVLGGMVVYGTVIYNNLPVSADAATNQDLKIGANPYKGLLAFQETDGDRFFGRDLQIKELWEKFRSLHEDESQTRLLTIYGPSGSGKSSLARAGLIPELARRPLQRRERARVAVLVPSSHPLESLATVLARIATNDSSPVAKTREFATELAQANAEGIYDGLRRIADALPEIEISPLIVLVDQLEEVFTLCKDSAERNAFISNLLCAAADRSKRVAAIVTLSSDFLGKAQQYSLNKLILKNGLLVMAMDEEELRQAIVEPAKLAWHLTNSKWYKPEVERHLIDVGTVNLLIEQTRGREGILPLLQFALQQIWVGLQAGEAPANTLDAIGGVAGALAGKAQRIYDKLEPEEQKIARRVFLGLVQLGEGVKDTRRRTELSRLSSHRDNPEQVGKVIGLFAHPDERLITLSNNGREDNKRAETAEVTHEALFENWQQLKDWLETSRRDLPFQRRLDEAAVIWDDHERPDGNLWRSPNLDLLRDFQERAGDDMTPLQQNFFQASSSAESVQKKAKKQQAQFNMVILAGTMVAMMSGIGIAISRHILYEQFAYCPTEKGRPGEKIKTEKTEETVCFRNLITSGEVGIFLSSTNYHLEQGVEFFKKEKRKKEINKGDYIEAIRQGDYAKAIEILQQAIHIEKADKEDYIKATQLFKQAMDADFRDPVPQIFWQNAQARTRSKTLKSKNFKSTILKLAVVASVDYYEKAASDVLRGVADAQNKFNENQGAEKPLLEIVIANDENEPAAAEKIAKLLMGDEGIIGVIGHHSSESTIAAQKTYNPSKPDTSVHLTEENQTMPVISSTSSSSELKGNQFFRTMRDTEKAAEKYVGYIRNKLNASKVIVFYASDSKYSEAITKDFRNKFNKPEEEIVDTIDISSGLDVKTKIAEITRNKESNVILVLTSIRKNSVAIEINKNIYFYNKDIKSDAMKIQVLGNLALSEQEAIEKGGKYVEGMTVVRPCLSLESPYMKDAIEKWSQGKIAINWRHATSYDATQAFITAIKMIGNSGFIQQKELTRKDILDQLTSKSFSVAKEDTSSGNELKWGEDHSIENGKYCLARIKYGEFKDKN